MDERRLEELLRERSRGLEPRLATPRFEARAQAALRGELGAERTRRLRLLAPLALVAAAAAVALVMLWGRPAAPALTGVAVELALLDEGGRELVEGDAVRGPGEDLPPPARVRLELLPAADGFARVFLYDARGALREPRAGLGVDLRAGVATLVDFELGGAWDPAAGGAGPAWVVAAAGAPFDGARLGLPDRLGAPSGAGRRAELEALAAQASAATGCRVGVRLLE